MRQADKDLREPAREMKGDRQPDGVSPIAPVGTHDALHRVTIASCATPDLAAGPATTPGDSPGLWSHKGALDFLREHAARRPFFDAWVAFWCKHGEALLAAAPYSEVAAQLVMMAFLPRVANGGGTVDREYALGRGRIDLCVRYRAVVFAIELKV